MEENKQVPTNSEQQNSISNLNNQPQSNNQNLQTSINQSQGFVGVNRVQPQPHTQPMATNQSQAPINQQMSQQPTPRPMPQPNFGQVEININNPTQPFVSNNQPTASDPMVTVSNLNKEDAMEEALSHTTQYTPFEVPKEEIKITNKADNKKAIIFIVAIFIIMLLFILFLPQISKIFG